MRIPLVVEHMTGAQYGELNLPSLLATPDSTVFTSNYPQPQFIFRHLETKQFIPTQVTIWSKTSKETSGGFPIGQGLVFISDNLADL